MLGPLQSLCIGCHGGSTQQIEKRGYDTAIGPMDGPLIRSIRAIASGHGEFAGPSPI